MTLSLVSWIRYLIWFAIGLILYVTYGIRNSSENPRNKTNKSIALESRQIDKIENKQISEEITE